MVTRRKPWGEGRNTGRLQQRWYDEIKRGAGLNSDWYRSAKPKHMVICFQKHEQTIQKLGVELMEAWKYKKYIQQILKKLRNVAVILKAIKCKKLEQLECILRKERSNLEPGATN